MSKIILSSCDFRNERSAKTIYDNIPCPINKCKVLYFPNEKATLYDIKSPKFYDRLEEFGFQKENIYVFNYFAPDEFDTTTHIDVIYISGGNTFGTLRLIRDANADRIITNYVKSGTSYIGGSAGAHIASASIEHVSKYDTNTFELTDFSGLKLIDEILICHYSKDREKDYLSLINDDKYKVIKLTDNDSAVFEFPTEQNKG